MPISILLNYSLPVVGIELCIVWVAVRCLLEPYVMPRLFHATFPKMDLGDQRSLTNHLVSFILKLICCIGGYSVWEVFIAHKAIDAPIKKPDELQSVTNGDILAFCYLTVPTIYIFELIYRTRISIVSAVHHIAAISINILGLIVVISEHQRGFLAETEFKLILIYGTFEMIFEVFPHLAVMLYRILRDRPSFLHKLFLYTALLIFAGTFLEQFAVGIFYFHVWSRIPVFYKASGPILHVCFMAAQIHGGRVCWQISRKMARESKNLREGILIASSGIAQKVEGTGIESNSTDSEVDLEAATGQGAREAGSSISEVHDQH